MRIDRLSLAAFGSFSDTVLDFDRGRSFHVVLGPNAAGKSTALRAIVDLLFGIPERTPDDFRHRGPQLRIGADIATADGRSFSFVRRKGRKDTLLGPDGKPIPESRLQACLGSMDRDRFVSMFGLGHERLRQGAEDLLRAGGALGESLFEAAGGTNSIRAVLDALSQEAGNLFRSRASNPRINAAIARYSEARQQARAAALSGENFHAMEEEIEAVSRKIAEQREELARLDADQRKLERIQRNLPRVAERAKVMEELAGLAGVPGLPANALEERLGLLGRRHQLEKTRSGTETEIERIDAELQGLHVPVELLEEAAVIRQLNENLGAVRAAAADLPKRRAELGGQKDAIEQLLAQARRGLTLQEAQSLRLAKPQVKRLRELAVRHAELRTARQNAEQTAVTARADLQDAEENLSRVPAPRDVRALADALQDVRREGNLQKEREESASRQDTLRRRAEAEAASLPGWHGSLDALATLAVPLAESVQKFATVLRSADQDVARARDRVDERLEELKEIEGEIGRLHASGEVPTVEELAGTRERRDRGWRLIRRAYVDDREDVGAAAQEYDAARALPEAYEANVSAADRLADRMRADAERVATDQSLRQRRGEAERRLAESRTSLGAAEQGRARLDAEWRELWTRLAVEPLTPGEMSSWLESHRRIRDTLQEARQEQERHERIVRAIDRCRELLAGALGSIGEPAPQGDVDVGVLMARCERCVKESEESARKRATAETSVAEAEKRLRAAETNRTDGETRYAEWMRDWTAAVAPLGFDETASPAEVEEFVNLVEEACARHQAVRDLERRIRRIEEDSEEFRQKVAALVARVAPQLADLPAERALAEITARHQQADHNQVSRKEKQDRLDSLRNTREETRGQLVDIEKDLDNLLRRAACSDLGQLEAVERQAARKRELEPALAGLEKQLIAEGAGLTLDQILDEVRDQDGDRIAAVIQERKAALENVRSERDTALQRHGELSKEREALSSRTNAAALAAQEAEQELAAIRADAEEYVRLRLAEEVLRAFVERYREQHQDPILARTSELFPILALGTFTAVRTDYDEKGDEPVLVGIDTNGTALGVQAMSDGTRDQLYLALRLAAVEQYLAAAEPLPFVADDLLVHFDDDRARAALRVLADFSRRTQVLFFTHHRHLVDLAQEVVAPELLGVHRMPVGR